MTVVPDVAAADVAVAVAVAFLLFYYDMTDMLARLHFLNNRSWGWVIF